MNPAENDESATAGWPGVPTTWFGRVGFALSLLGVASCSWFGCHQTVAINPSTTDPNNTVWVDGVVYEPSVVKNQSGFRKIAPSGTYWVLPGESIFVKWSDYHVRAPEPGGTWDCNLCAERAAINNHSDICPAPDGAHLAIDAAPAQTRFFEAQANAHAAGPFSWSSGCFVPTTDPAHPDNGPNAALSFTVSQAFSSLWTATATIAGTDYHLHGRDVYARLFTVPQGGHAVMSPISMTQFLDPVSGRPDPDHWQWVVGTSTDSLGRVIWEENFGGGLGVGRVRVYKGQLVHSMDPIICWPLNECDYLDIRGTVVPASVRVYSTAIIANPAGGDPLAHPTYACSADPTAPSGDGDINFRQCRGIAPMGPITPAYDPSDPTSQTPGDPPTRQPLIWIVEFNSSFPPPLLAVGESFWIEFTLLDTR